MYCLNTSRLSSCHCKRDFQLCNMTGAVEVEY